MNRTAAIIFSMPFVLLHVAVGSLAAAEQRPADQPGVSPITIQVREGGSGYASFLNRFHAGNRIGYRFFEHAPLVFGTVPASADAWKNARADAAAARQAMLGRPGVAVYRKEIFQADSWTHQSWQIVMVPVVDGVELLWLIETHEHGLPSYHGVQQCFRLGGTTNQEWRRAIAETPDFSEFDLWHSQKSPSERTSLTYVLRGGTWQPFPPVDLCVGARTPSGVTIDKERSGGHLPERVGPYNAKMLDPIDGGLITRTNSAKTWICGIFWQRTSHVTDHHPADCLHAIVNLGGIPPRSIRMLRGKIYWFEGTLADLVHHWHTDFHSPMGD
jgi:hypothetical protein